MSIFLYGCGSKNSQDDAKQTVTKSGKVQAIKGDDYSHILITPSGNVKLNSYSVKLQDYEGKEIEVTGEYSGDTLFVDKVK